MANGIKAGALAIAALFYGSQSATAAYLGGQQVYTAEALPPPDTESSIRSLYANGEVGAWYDISDRYAVWQDSDGGLLSQIGDPVGLVLDRRIAKGSNLVTNGHFDTDLSGWSPFGGTQTWEAGRAKLVAPVSDDGRLYGSASGLVVGEPYLYSADYEIIDADSAMIEAGGNGFPLESRTVYASSKRKGRIGLLFVAQSEKVDIYLRTWANSSNTGTTYFDNVSLEKVSGNHATQTTSACKPTLMADATGYDAPIIEDLFTDSLGGWRGNGSTASLDNGRMHLDVTASWGGAIRDSGTTTYTPGEWYEAEFDVEFGTKTSCLIVARDGSSPISQTVRVDSNGTHRLFFNATKTSHNFQIQANNELGTMWVDNFRVRRIQGLQRYRLKFDGVDDHMLTGVAPNGSSMLAAAYYGTVRDIILGSANSNWSGRCYLGYSQDLIIVAGGWGGDNTSVLRGSAVQSTPLTGLLIADPSAVKLRTSGVEEYSGSPNGSPNTTHELYLGTVNLGGTISSAEMFKGDFYGGLLLMGRSPTASEVTTVEDYLQGLYQ